MKEIINKVVLLNLNQGGRKEISGKILNVIVKILVDLEK